MSDQYYHELLLSNLSQAGLPTALATTLWQKRGEYETPRDGLLIEILHWGNKSDPSGGLAQARLPGGRLYGQK